MMLSTLYAARHEKSPLMPRSIYDILTQSSSDLQCFVKSSVNTMYTQKHGECEERKVDTENRWFKCEWTEQFWVSWVTDTIFVMEYRFSQWVHSLTHHKFALIYFQDLRKNIYCAFTIAIKITQNNIQTHIRHF